MDDLHDPTLSTDSFRLICSQSTSTYSALEVLHFMRYINLRLTYLLTYIISSIIQCQIRKIGEIYSENGFSL